jgi:putative transposase
MGLKDLMVLSNGDTLPNIKPYQFLESKLAKAQRSLSRKEYGSANYHKAKIKVARIHERIANIRLDYLHKVTSALVKNHDFIAILDLDVEAMLKDKHLAKSVGDVSLSKLVELLAYKAEWHDRKLVKVDRHFPSSQLCSACGYKNSKVKNLAVRGWRCPSCQTRHDRDQNASIDILKEGERIHLQSTVGTTGVA